MPGLPGTAPAKSTRRGVGSSGTALCKKHAGLGGLARRGTVREGVQKSMRGKPRIYGYVNAGAGLVRRGSAGIGTRMDERVISADARHTVGAGLARHGALQDGMPCRCRACAGRPGRYRDTDGRTRDQRGCPPHRRCRACPARRHRPARRHAKNTRGGVGLSGAARFGRACKKSMRGKPRIYRTVCHAGAGLVRRGRAGIGIRMDERVISPDACHTP